jgi:carboxypeptidase Taq
MISWDTETEAPEGALPFRSEQVGVLTEESYKMSTSSEYVKTVSALYEKREELTPWLNREIGLVKKDIDQQLKIPMNEYVDYQVLLSQTQNIWAKAKRANDFDLFRPYLEKIVGYERKIIKYLETDEVKGYDVLLDMYEEGMKATEYDQFFNTLRKDLVPFVLKVINSKQKDYAFSKQKYPVAQQKKFVDYLIDVMKFDRNRGLTKESEHPFTSGICSTDVRYTDHYYEDNFTSSIFSAIHEMGHAIYEQQCDPKLDSTMLYGGVSMAVHESQSRFFENIIGRSYDFWKVHFPKLKEIFPDQLKDVSLDDFYHYINKSFASLIRTEADELTYPLHIMLRYEIEKGLMDGSIEVKDLPKIWNKKMNEYLGITPETNKEGVLQDVHWSGGMIGYFPTYALGSAYSAQIYHAMQKDLDITKILLGGTTKEINEWLKEKIHHYGRSVYPKDVVKMATGEDFKPEYYVRYLTEKYSKIYNIK